MAYTGAWRRKTLGTDPNPNLGGGVDMRHLDPVEPDPAVPMPEKGLPVVPASLYAADDFMLPAVYRLPADPPLDRSPEDHQAGAADRGNEAASHFQDDGGPRAAHYYQPGIMREHDSSYRTERIEQAPAVSQSRGQLVQGVDRDGPSPQGHGVMRWIDRRVVRKTITPDAYPLYPYRAAVSKQSKALPAGDGNQYLSPFDKIVGVKRTRVNVPMIRRIPPPYADQEITDGTEAPSAGFWEF